MKSKIYFLSVVLAISIYMPFFVTTASAVVIEFEDPTTNIGGVPAAFQYGDFYSYSLPINQYLRDGTKHISNTDYYYVKSTPGDLRNNAIVLVTGAGGNYNSPWADFTNQNPDATMDQPYASPNGVGGEDYFRTGDPVSNIEPGPGANQFTGDNLTTWDTRLSSLNTYLGGLDLIIYFNNNQTDLNQSLFAWGQVVIKDDANLLTPLRFDFTNIGATLLNPIPNPGFTSPSLANNNYPNILYPDPSGLPAAGTYPQQGDFVYSGGEVTVNGITFDHNLGADNAAYAIFSPELNNIVKNYTTNGYDYLQADIRFTALNNGYEQVFIEGGRIKPPVIPEPSTLFLFGSGVIGLAGIFFKKK